MFQLAALGGFAYTPQAPFPPCMDVCSHEEKPSRCVARLLTYEHADVSSAHPAFNQIVGCCASNLQFKETVIAPATSHCESVSCAVVEIAREAFLPSSGRVSCGAALRDLVCSQEPPCDYVNWVSCQPKFHPIRALTGSEIVTLRLMAPYRPYMVVFLRLAVFINQYDFECFKCLNGMTVPPGVNAYPPLIPSDQHNTRQSLRK
ncbi:hypothetical protein Bbelb_337720 [Branchiostoma belcheri]|nr:hypothetical protein Bbelb_337720 [Branchiostoma belcheri]